MVGDASKKRLFAMALDNALATLLAVLPAAKIAAIPDSVRWPVAIVLYLAIFFIQEGIWSSTVGKRIFGLEIRRGDGALAGWREAAIRTALRIVEVNPILAGGIPAGIAIISSKSRKRLGDLIADTIVVPKLR